MTLLAMIEKIHWADTAERLPDADTTVLCFWPEAEDEPVWPGYTDGECWYTADGFPVFRGAPTYWAHMPGGPK